MLPVGLRGGPEVIRRTLTVRPAPRVKTHENFLLRQNPLDLVPLDHLLLREHLHRVKLPRIFSFL